MPLLSVEESKLVRSCLGSREPYDRIWAGGGHVAAASDELMLVVEGAANWEGGLLGTPFTDFLRLAGDEARIDPQENGVKLSRGKVTLTLPLAPLKDFAWPKTPMAFQSLRLETEAIEEMHKVVAANGETGLQVTRFEMLGFAISKGVGYSLSLEALIKSKRKFPEGISLLLPSPFLSVLLSALKLYKHQEVEISFNDRMVFSTFRRGDGADKVTLGAAVPAIASWLEVDKISAPLQDAAPVNVDLSYLEKDLSLLQSLSRTIALSKAGVRCGAAHAWYEAESVVNLPSDCSLSTSRLASILPLAPRLTRVGTQVVEMEGESFTAYLATAGA